MRHLPPLASLRAFEAAARHLSFSRAAAELGVTGTAISHQVRLLEEICGKKLFQRRPRPLALTSAGQQLYPVLQHGLDAFAVTLAAISSETACGPLRVTTPSAFASRWLVPRLPRWRAVHADIPLEVIGSNALLDLRAGEADLAIRYAHSTPVGLVARELFRDIYFPVCSQALLSKGRPIRSAADLLAYPLIHFEWLRAKAEVPNWRRWLNLARSVDPELPELTRSWDLSFREEQHAIDAVMAGQGIGILSNVVVGGELSGGTLVRAHDLALPGFGYFLTYPHDAPRQPLIHLFSAWLENVC